MKLNKLIAAMAVTLALAGVAAPAGAVPPDKGSASKDCEGADIRATRIDQGLCDNRAGAPAKRLDTIERTSSVTHSHDSPWWAAAVLAGVAMAAGTVFLLRRPSTTA